MEVTVPWYATVTVRVSDLGDDTVRLAEGDRVIWQNGHSVGEKAFPEGIEPRPPYRWTQSSVGSARAPTSSS